MVVRDEGKKQVSITAIQVTIAKTHTKSDEEFFCRSWYSLVELLGDYKISAQFCGKCHPTRDTP